MTMIERVARAMLAVDYPADADGDLEEMWWERRGDAYLAYARAAIQAMREPTEAMAIAGGGEPYLATSEQPLVFGEIREVIAPENIWQAMIDAALEEKPE